MARLIISLVFLLLQGISPSEGKAQSLSPYSYDIGTPTLTDYYIDPVSGSDSNSGLSPAQAWRTVQHAWGQIPQSTPLSDGFQLNLYNGDYGNDELPNYWELRRGTAAHPIILRSAAEQSNVRFVRDINMANVSYFYLIGVEITPKGGGDAFHCEQCDHILLRGSTFNGGSTNGGARETIKVNQSQYVYIENNNVSNADDNNIDFVGVQYGHIIGNRVHSALDWCAYVKGGSAYIRVESNEFFNCGTGGFTAGQGSGFQFMTSPWIHYEAYDIKVLNNIVHDTEGAAFGVNGGYNILLAHNTAYKVGTRNQLLEVVFGERTCDGQIQGAADSTCSSYNSSGGWGANSVDLTPEPIGNRNVYVLNNILYNPAGTSSPQHFAIYGPRTPEGGMNLASSQSTDSNLVIKGNVIWNGTGSTLTGIEESDQGCQPGNPTCSLAQLLADNTINSIEPSFRDATASDFRPSEGSALFSLSSAPLASFPGGDRVTTPLASEGILPNSFLRDFSGAESSGTRFPGAFNSTTAALSPPAIGESTVPPDPSVSAPTIPRLSLKATQVKSRAKVTISARVSSSETPSSVTATIKKGSTPLAIVDLTLSNASYKRSIKVRARLKARLTVSATATNSGGSTSVSRKVKVL